MEPSLHLFTSLKSLSKKKLDLMPSLLDFQHLFTSGCHGFGQQGSLHYPHA